MALSADRKLDSRTTWPVEYGYLVAPGSIVYRGSIAAITAAFTIVPAGGPGAEVIVGISERQMNGTPPAQGAPVSGLQPTTPIYVKCRKGSFMLPFDAAPPASAIGTPVYAIDDQTVSLSNGAVGGGAATRLQCGVLEGFDQAGNPWVRMI
jgi:hypothetical protein